MVNTTRVFINSNKLEKENKREQAKETKKHEHSNKKHNYLIPIRKITEIYGNNR